MNERNWSPEEVQRKNPWQLAKILLIVATAVMALLIGACLVGMTPFGMGGP